MPNYCFSHTSLQRDKARIERFFKTIPHKNRDDGASSPFCYFNVDDPIHMDAVNYEKKQDYKMSQLACEIISKMTCLCFPCKSLSLTFYDETHKKRVEVTDVSQMDSMAMYELIDLSCKINGVATILTLRHKPWPGLQPGL